jgi:hypothetical protein
MSQGEALLHLISPWSAGEFHGQGCWQHSLEYIHFFKLESGIGIGPSWCRWNHFTTDSDLHDSGIFCSESSDQWWFLALEKIDARQILSLDLKEGQVQLLQLLQQEWSSEVRISESLIFSVISDWILVNALKQIFESWHIQYLTWIKEFLTWIKPSKISEFSLLPISR